jgi:GNAT superfamily N-acetyltransferase
MVRTRGLATALVMVLLAVVTAVSSVARDEPIDFADAPFVIFAPAPPCLWFMAPPLELPPATTDDETHAGSAVGGALLAVVEEQWRELEAPAAVLWVIRSNERARAVYAHLGWSPDGTTRDLKGRR